MWTLCSTVAPTMLSASPGPVLEGVRVASVSWVRHAAARTCSSCIRVLRRLTVHRIRAPSPSLLR
jgi:hypothetical protein